MDIQRSKIRNIATGWATLRAIAAFALLSVATGCTANGPSPMASQSFGPTVAFESVDGPPPQVFDRLVKALETESPNRSFSIVSREAPASYRVRSYLSAQVDRGKTIIAWVWDVYDRDHHRTLRLSGEEPAGKNPKDAWASADDGVIRRIAQAGLAGLNGLIDGTAPAETAPAPQPASPAGPAIASRKGQPKTASAGSSVLAFNGR
jgi:ABC-type glycerol-3-phosphate transport system substrate-binding protein